MSQFFSLCFPAHRPEAIWFSRSWFIAVTDSSEPVLFFSAAIRFHGHSPLSCVARELTIFASHSKLTLFSATDWSPMRFGSYCVRLLVSRFFLFFCSLIQCQWMSCQVIDFARKPVLLLSRRIKRLDFFQFSSCSCGGFSDTLIRCLVKCSWGTELLCSLILVADDSHETLQVSIVVFRCVFQYPNPVPRTNTFSIAMWVWPS
jgi:hypothetical protein